MYSPSHIDYLCITLKIADFHETFEEKIGFTDANEWTNSTQIQAIFVAIISMKITLKLIQEKK